jgi:hypothetical protein
VRSICGKIALLNLLLNTEKPDVLACSETWCKMNEIEQVRLCNYELANAYGRERIAHGGAALYIRNGIQYKQRNDLQRVAVQYHFELTSIEILYPNLIIIATYRTGKGDFDIFISRLELLLSKVTTENKRFILVGDLNVDFLSENSSKRKLNDILGCYDCANTVGFPTRVCADSSTCIDVGIVSRTCDVTAAPIHTPISDHNAQVFALSTEHLQREKCNTFIERRLINDQSLYLFYYDIDNYNWNFVYNKDVSINNKFCKLINILTYYIDIHFPIKKIRIKNKPNVPWMTDEIKKYMENFNDLSHFREQYPENSGISRCINHYSDLIKRKVLEARQDYTQKRLRESQNPSKEIWEIIKDEVSPAQDRKEITLNCNTKPIPKKDIPGHLNSHFLSIASKLNVGVDEQLVMRYLTDFLQTANVSTIELPVVTRADLDRVLKILTKRRSTLDIYDISVNIMLSIWPILSEMLVTLINEVFSTGVYPDILKYTRVCPVYKSKGEKTSVDNYRPISIVPSISKIIESILSQLLMKHLENDLVTDRQFAYRKSKSTTSAAYDMINSITTGLDDKYKIAGIFCDLSKAFDVINHDLLIKKLKCYGLLGGANDLMKSFLENRTQAVEVMLGGKRMRSGSGSVTVGIPQGSALGNTLFLAYINDLPSAITEGQITLFADDTTVVVKARTYELLSEKISTVCDQLKRWFSANGLILNVSKSNIMVFSSRCAPSVSIQCPIPTSDKCKFLGFTVDPTLNWKQHVDLLCNRLGGAVFALRKLKPLISRDALRQVYFSHFHSLMTYGVILWGNSTDAGRVMRMQKRALRTMLGLNQRQSCKTLFTEHRIMTHYSQYLFEVIMYTKRHLPQFKRVEVTGKCLRSTGKLRTVPRRTALHAKNARVIGPTYYEHLPADIKSETCEVTFKRRLKNLLLEKSFYSVDEYIKIIK